MNKIIENCICLFSKEYKQLLLDEDCDIVEAKYSIEKFDKNLPTSIDLSMLNMRDSIFISFFDSCEEPTTSYDSEKNNWSSFVDDLKQIDKHQNATIKVTITKKKIKQYLSIYYIDKFVNYIEKLSLSQFLSVINERFKGYLIFEVQNESYHLWKTQTIAFISRNSCFEFASIEEDLRNKRYNKAMTLCYRENCKFDLLPEDLYCQNYDKNDNLQSFFNKACLLFTYSFIFDYSLLDREFFTYKLNGFRPICADIPTISNVNLDLDTCNKIYNIYQWIYQGGSNIDKINIARNIISLNINKESLYLENSTFASILSNFKIFEKENIKQYLDVRNKLSEILLNLQERIGTIMGNFINDFKKTLITIVSFFISIIAIRVVSKGDFIGGFTNEIILLSIILLIISVGILIYSHWELSNKISLYNKHYEQIKKRYKDILSEIELDDIFEECNPSKTDTNKSFITKQKKYYTLLWILSIIFLLLFLLVIFFINNHLCV